MLTHLRDRMADALRRATEVEQLLADPETVKDAPRLAALGREHHRLAEVVQKVNRYTKVEAELADAREMAAGDDADFAAEARAEVERLDAECTALEKALLPLLIPRDPLDDRPAILNCVPAPEAMKPRSLPPTSCVCTRASSSGKAGALKVFRTPTGPLAV